MSGQIRKNSPPRRDAERERQRKVARGSRAAMLIVLVLIFAFGGLLIHSAGQIQIIDYEKYAIQAAKQHYNKLSEFPQRGRIISADGRDLAVSSYVYTVGVTPASFLNSSRDPAKIAAMKEMITTAIDMSPVELETVLSDRTRPYIILKKEVTVEQKDALQAGIKELRVGGLTIDPVEKRYYPFNSLAASVIGFANQPVDTLVGVTGIESSYNDILSGQAGYRFLETDNYGSGALPYSVPLEVQARNGSNVVLNIDTQIQAIAEEVMGYYTKQYNTGDGSLAIIVRPDTGAIVAMAGSNVYDLNDPSAAPDGYDPEEWNPNKDESQLQYMTAKLWPAMAVNRTYEPGSTMKVLTAAMAIEENAVRMNEEFSDAPLIMKGWEKPISSHIFPNNFGWVNIAEALWHSSNPVFVQIGQRVGIERFYNYINALGFRERTRIDLPAESVGMIHTKPTPIDLAVFAFGEQSTVTPIQFVMAYSAVANGGRLMRPQIAQKLTDSFGNVTHEFMPVEVRRVFSEETCATLRNMMRGVITEGSAPFAAALGIDSVCKTGTSSYGDYDEFKVVSVVGMYPRERPDYVVLTMFFNETYQIGSYLPQMANRDIIRRLSRLEGYERSYTQREIARQFWPLPMPELTGLRLHEAIYQIDSRGDSYDVPEGADMNAYVAAVLPRSAEGQRLGGYKSYYLSMDGSFPDFEPIAMPNFVGLNLDQVMELARENKLNLTLKGSNWTGTVTEQDIAAHTEEEPSYINPYSVIELVFKGESEVATASVKNEGVTPRDYSAEGGIRMRGEPEIHERKYLPLRIDALAEQQKIFPPDAPYEDIVDALRELNRGKGE